MGYAKFEVTAGALLRGSIRNSLNKAKFRIEDVNPDAVVSVHESKGWLKSDFIFSAHNLTPTQVADVEVYIRKIRRCQC